jgi:hypothetical protein
MEYVCRPLAFGISPSISQSSLLELMLDTSPVLVELVELLRVEVIVTKGVASAAVNPASFLS